LFTHVLSEKSQVAEHVVRPVRMKGPRKVKGRGGNSCREDANKETMPKEEKVGLKLLRRETTDDPLSL